MRIVPANDPATVTNGERDLNAAGLVLPPDSVYSKTIGNLSMSAISSGTGVVGQTSTVFHCERPES